VVSHNEQKTNLGLVVFRMSSSLVVLLLSALGGCHRKDVAAPLPVAVRVATLQREQITSPTRFTATVRERQRVELSFKVTGTVATLLQVPDLDGKQRDVHEGDVVVMDPNQPLARLDDADSQRRLETARERLAQAQAQERATLATLTGYQAGFERVKALRERASVSQQEYDDALAKKDTAAAELEATQREVSAARVGIQQAEDDLKNCSLFVPIPNATVSKKTIEGNERVMPNQPVFELMDLSAVRLAFGVPDSKISQFELGQTLRVTADSFQGEHFEGRVTKIGPAADLKTRTFEVEVTIDAPRKLRPGMVVTVLVGHEEELVLLPMTAIQRGRTAEEFAVYAVVDENGLQVARKRRVELDGVYDNRIRLIEGGGSELGTGDAIVVTGAFRLTDGQVVRVIEVPDPGLKIGI
jgi:RND family efflux transporter MFP subunit